MKKLLLALLLASTPAFGAQKAKQEPKHQKAPVQAPAQKEISPQEAITLVCAQLCAVAEDAQKIIQKFDEQIKARKLSATENELYEKACIYLQHFSKWFEELNQLQSGKKADEKLMHDLFENACVACDELVKAWQAYETDCTQKGQPTILVDEGK